MIFWRAADGSELAQGDLLPRCVMPLFLPPDSDIDDPLNLPLVQADLIVVTQSCDLQNHKVQFVALCPIHSLQDFEEINPEFRRRGQWESVRKGRVEGLHLLASPTDPDNNRAALVVDFGHIVSLPFDYLVHHADALGDRWRLEPPYLEHFSQAFARFFMRVGLPTAIAAYK